MMAPTEGQSSVFKGSICSALYRPTNRFTTDGFGFAPPQKSVTRGLAGVLLFRAAGGIAKPYIHPASSPIGAGIKGWIVNVRRGGVNKCPSAAIEPEMESLLRINNICFLILDWSWNSGIFQQYLTCGLTVAATSPSGTSWSIHPRSSVPLTMRSPPPSTTARLCEASRLPCVTELPLEALSRNQDSGPFPLASALLFWPFSHSVPYLLHVCIY